MQILSLLTSDIHCTVQLKLHSMSLTTRLYQAGGGGVDKEGREGEGGHVTMCINVSPSLQFMRIYFYID